MKIDPFTENPYHKHLDFFLYVIFVSIVHGLLSCIIIIS
jgi:hypothetical protein